MVNKITMANILKIGIKEMVISWTCQKCTLLRTYSQNVPKKKSFKETILLPKTNFPARHPADKRAELDKKIQKTAQFDTLYEWQRENLKEPEFILHDGPPYANGDLHIGHAVNKIIKDISNRHHILSGQKINFIPGWDCHGLPIELKALSSQKSRRNDEKSTDKNLDVLSIRDIARKFAKETSIKQMNTFKSWGIVADWNNAYYTFDKDYVINQTRQFFELYQKGMIYRALKPVYWSPSTRTALAEAELEYDPNFKSTQVYVAFPLVKIPQQLVAYSKGKNISAIIWTTTPWTLAVNKAICFNPNLKYCLLTNKNNDNEQYIVCKDTIEQFSKEVGVEISFDFEFDASLLQEATYKNPLFPQEPNELRFLPANHVVASHTGLVHTAPAHGPDDFLVATEHKINVECNVDENGCYTGLCDWLDGKYVLGEGQESVISHLGSALLHKSNYVHSYPCDWRSGQPVILRASKQWFIRTDVLKEKALKCLQSVEMLPASSAVRNKSGFEGQVSRRPYWCISRQRAWGVPIPVLYSNDCEIVDKSVIERLCKLIQEQDTDAWWKCSLEDLIPKELGLNPDNVTKGQDIMDIWMDSGVSWSYVLTEGVTSDVCCEGVDQLTGWFQSSLLTSVALRDRAPYKSIFVHGFVVDSEGRKMSKSVGNVIDPVKIIQGGTNKKKEPAYGVDTLRWWVASHGTQHSQIILSDNLINDCFTEITRFRNTYKFLLGNITDMSKSDIQAKHDLNLLDKYILNELSKFKHQNSQHYKKFQFNSVSKNILNFVSNQLSSVYCHIVKDRLYCLSKSDKSRLSCQVVLHTILIELFKSMAPILPYLVEEAWTFHPLYEGKPFYKTLDIPILTIDSLDNDIVDILLDIKKDLLKNSNKIDQFNVNIHVTKNLYDNLMSKSSVHEVSDILQVSSVNVSIDNSLTSYWTVNFNMTNKSQCVRCRRFSVEDSNNDNCERCVKVLSEVELK